MPEGHDTTIKISNIMSFVLYTQILKQSVLKPASPGITLTLLTVLLFTFVTTFFRFSGWSYIQNVLFNQIVCYRPQSLY